MRPRGLTEDPTYYRIEYGRIVQQLHAATAARPGDPEKKTAPCSTQDLEEMLDAIRRDMTTREEDVFKGTLPDQALNLLRLATTELRELRWRWVGKRPPWYVRWCGWRRWRLRREQQLLGAFLDTVLEPAALVLYCSCLIEKKGWLPRSPEGPPGVALDRKTAFWSTGGKKGRIDAWLNSYLAYLCYGEGEGKPRHWHMRWVCWLDAKTTPVRACARRLFGWLGFTLWREPEEVSYRVRYNLACMFSRAAKSRESEADLDLAQTQLALCMKRVSVRDRLALAEWAATDPSLAWLRKTRPEEFAKIVPHEDHAPAAPVR